MFDLTCWLTIFLHFGLLRRSVVCALQRRSAYDHRRLMTCLECVVVSKFELNKFKSCPFCFPVLAWQNECRILDGGNFEFLLNCPNTGTHNLLTYGTTTE
jgi:hypothetical protein